MFYLRLLLLLLLYWSLTDVIANESQLLKGLLLSSSINGDDSDETEIIIIRVPNNKRKRANKQKPVTITTTTTTTRPTESPIRSSTDAFDTESTTYRYSDLFLDSLTVNSTVQPRNWTPFTSTSRPNTSPKTAVKVTNVCGANQTYTHCLNECGTTCQGFGKSSFCKWQCLGFGCTCAPGYVRDLMTDRCVAQEDCPQSKCPIGERFYNCGGCGATCDKPNPVCDHKCKPLGDCDCVKGLYRNANGKCVPSSLCHSRRSRAKTNSTLNSSQKRYVTRRPINNVDESQLVNLL